MTAKDQRPGFKQNLEIWEIEKKDTKTQRGWQLDDFFEALEKEKRPENVKSSADRIHRGTYERRGLQRKENRKGYIKKKIQMSTF